MTATPNPALQRTAPAVTLAASCLRLSPTTQPARQPPRSLSLGSLGDSARLLYMQSQKTKKSSNTMKLHRILLLLLAAISVTAFAAITSERATTAVAPQVMIRADVTRQTPATATAPAKTDILQRPVIFTTPGRPAVLAIPDGKGNTIKIELTITLPPTNVSPTATPK